MTDLLMYEYTFGEHSKGKISHSCTDSASDRLAIREATPENWLP